VISKLAAGKLASISGAHMIFWWVKFKLGGTAMGTIVSCYGPTKYYLYMS